MVFGARCKQYLLSGADEPEPSPRMPDDDATTHKSHHELVTGFNAVADQAKETVHALINQSQVRPQSFMLENNSVGTYQCKEVR
jgi:hypothetical protein